MLFGTVAIPFSAFAPSVPSGDLDALSLSSTVDGVQSLEVSDEITVDAAARTAYEAPSEADLERARQAELALARQAVTSIAYSGPSVREFLADPPYPSFSLDLVVQEALQYQGVPYVFGGSSPAGFDCSGYVRYVFSKFGIDLPHSVPAQAALGTAIAREDAVAGDIVIMPGHNGFYMGNGMILDAPRAGGVVSVRPIWTDNYYIVRIGI